MEKQERNYTITERVSGKKVELTEQEFKALRVAAENPDLNIAEIAEKLSLENSSTYNLLSKGYAKIGVKHRDAAMRWYNENVKRQVDVPLAREGMLNSQRIELQQREYSNYMIIICVLFCILVFLPIKVLQTKEGFINVWSNLYAAVPIAGSVFGYKQLRDANKETRVPYSSAVINFCLGSLCWGIGELIWLCYNVATYYRVINESFIPYPSYADIGYVTGIIYMLLGVKDIYNKTIGRILPSLPFILVITSTFGIIFAVVVLTLRGWTLMQGQDPWKLILDVFYPTADIATLTILCLLAIHPTLQTIYTGLRKPIYIFIIGMVLYLVADASFSITTTLPEEHPWSYFPGNWTDLIFNTTFCVISLGILRLPLLSFTEPWSI
jgi:DNA-binding CsgD family transcriptional regulator